MRMPPLRASLLRKPKRLTPGAFCLKYTGYHHQKTYNSLRLLLTESMRFFPGMERPVKLPADGHKAKPAHAGAEHRNSARTEGGAPGMHYLIDAARSYFREGDVAGISVFHTTVNTFGFSTAPHTTSTSPLRADCRPWVHDKRNVRTGSGPIAHHRPPIRSRPIKA